MKPSGVSATALPAPCRMTRRLATEGVTRSATPTTAREYASSASASSTAVTGRTRPRPRGPRCLGPRSGSAAPRRRRASPAPRTARRCRPARGRPPRPAGRPSGCRRGRRGSPASTAAHQQPGALGQAHRVAHATGHAGRGHGHAQARRRGGLAAREPQQAVADGGGGGHGQDQAALQPDAVDPQQSPLGVHQRAAGGPARQGSAVLDGALDAPSAGTAETPAGDGHEAQRGAQAPPAGVGEGDYRRAQRGGRAVLGPFDGRGVTGVEVEDGEVEVEVRGADAARRRARRRCARPSPPHRAGCGRW